MHLFIECRNVATTIGCALFNVDADIYIALVTHIIFFFTYMLFNIYMFCHVNDQ